MTRLLIARHGNTFTAEDTPLRVGARTDLPLVESGITQAQEIGHYLREAHLYPSAVYSGRLQRAHDTARIALETLEQDTPIVDMDMFNEIDYGPDEGKTEEEVIKRIGKAAIAAWDKEGVVPSGWKVKPPVIISQWKEFSKNITAKHRGETVLVVTSNGIARFAPHITGDFEEFSQHNSIKIATGALCSFIHSKGRWQLEYWNKKPSKE